MPDWLILIASFLIGSIPFSVIVGKYIYGVDVRSHGSGNPGATNTLRTLGTKAGIIVLLLDIFKGVGAVLLGKFYLHLFFIEPDNMMLSGTAAALGHMFSPFLGFKGGKGVATTFGVMLTIPPYYPGIIAAAIFLIVAFITRYVSLSSILSLAGFCVVSIIIYPSLIFLNIFAIGLAILIIYKHRSNIRRLIKGEENRFAFKKKAAEQF